MDGVLAIAVSEAKMACEGEPDVIKRLEKAMAKTCNFWMSTDDQLRLRAACAAVMLTGSTEDQDRVARSWKALATLSAAMSSIPVNFDGFADSMADDLIPLMQMWHEAKVATA